MKQIRALRANGIVMLVSSVITAVCVGVCWKHFPIAVQVIYICIALMFAIFGGAMLGESIWLTKQKKEKNNERKRRNQKA